MTDKTVESPGPRWIRYPKINNITEVVNKFCERLVEMEKVTSSELDFNNVTVDYTFNSVFFNHSDAEICDDVIVFGFFDEQPTRSILVQAMVIMQRNEFIGELVLTKNTLIRTVDDFIKSCLISLSSPDNLSFFTGKKLRPEMSGRMN